MTTTMTMINNIDEIQHEKCHISRNILIMVIFQQYDLSVHSNYSCLHHCLMTSIAASRGKTV